MSDILRRWRAGEGLPGVLAIDGHLHFHDWPHGPNFESVEAAARGGLAFMDAHGVDAGCVLGGGHFVAGSDYVLGNDDLLDLWCRAPDRFIPFGHVNPNDDAGRILTELDRLYRRGARCLKLINSYQQAYPGDGPNLMEVYRFAAEHRMLVLNHSWTNAEIAAISRQFPCVDFILGHYSNSRDPVLRECPNVYTSTWNLGSLSFIERGVREVGPDKFLYGSDAFMNPLAFGIGQVVYADIPDEAKRRILGLNQARLLDKVGALPSGIRERYAI
jgi:predicted TIM-barrel fold metal-dependent hydrolase